MLISAIVLLLTTMIAPVIAFVALFAYHRLFVYHVLGMKAYVLWCIVVRVSWNVVMAMWRLKRVPRSLNDLWISGPAYSVEENYDRPVTSGASATIRVTRRVRCAATGQLVFAIDGDAVKSSVLCLNTGSYNYLGYGGAEKGVRKSVLGAALTMDWNQRLELQRKVEQGMCDFLGNKPACIVQATGYSTNACVLPVILELWPNTLMLSDAYNHVSIVMGSKAAQNGTDVRIFTHSDIKSLQAEYEKAGGPERKRVVVVVEGLYSMEGTYCPLPELVEWCNEHPNAWLYVDEAHSIGVVGPSGRGVCDHYGIPTAAVHFLMGTFTKSFASVGGYVTFFSEEVAEEVRSRLEQRYHPTPLPAACSAQILQVLEDLNGDEGLQRVDRLHRNACYVRSELLRAQLEVLGELDSPVIPVMIRDLGFLDRFNSTCLDLGVAVVTVAYPATPLLEGGRVRLCMSSAHTQEHLRQIVETVISVLKAVSGGDPFGMVSAPAYFVSPPSPLKLVDDEGNGKGKEEEEEENGELVAKFSRERMNCINRVKDKVRSREGEHLGFEWPPPSTDEINDVPLHRFRTPFISEKSTGVVQATLVKYGCGSCGPRGFYGTMIPHLTLERFLATHFHKEAAALYPHTQCLVSSVLPALINPSLPMGFLQRLGLHSVDVLYYIAPYGMASLRYDVQLALRLVRCRVMRTVSHTLENGQVRESIKAYMNESTGVQTSTTDTLMSIAWSKKSERAVVLVTDPVDAKVIRETARIHKRRDVFIVLDAFSIPFAEVVHAARYCDVILGSLEHAVGGLGGYCVGSAEMVRYQRIYGRGYVFSASPPPYLCRLAVEVLSVETN